METDSIQAPPSSELADLQAVRTALALDRTLLATTRTALSLIGFGFTLAKFVHDLIQKGILHGVQPGYPRQVGYTLMCLGILTLICGAIHYIHLARKIGKAATLWSVPMMVTIGLSILSVFLMFNLLPELQQN